MFFLMRAYRRSLVRSYNRHTEWLWNILGLCILPLTSAVLTWVHTLDCRYSPLVDTAPITAAIFMMSVFALRLYAARRYEKSSLVLDLIDATFYTALWAQYLSLACLALVVMPAFISPVLAGLLTQYVVLVLLALVRLNKAYREMTR